VVAWRQLVDVGIGPALIEARVSKGLLLPVHRGVFAVGHRRIGIYGERMAAVLACGPGAALSHGSAMQLWGIRGTRRPIEVTRVSGHQRPGGVRPHGVWLHQTRSLPIEHTTVEARIPVTSLERTFLDMAVRLDERQLEHDLVEAERSGRLRWSVLWRLVTDHGRGRRGIRKLKLVMARADPRFAEAVSPPEVDFLILCRNEGLKMPQVNVLVDGRKVDFYWPRERLIVESDSYDYHGDRPAFERDHSSTVALELAGYRVLRPTARMLRDEPAQFTRLVRERLAA
jgi:hypothetical protein